MTLSTLSPLTNAENEDSQQPSVKPRVSHTRRLLANGLRGLSRTLASTCKAPRTLIVNDNTAVPILPDVEVMPDPLPLRCLKRKSNNVPSELRQEGKDQRSKPSVSFLDNDQDQTSTLDSPAAVPLLDHPTDPDPSEPSKTAESDVDDERCSENYEITFEIDRPHHGPPEISNNSTSSDAHRNAIRRLTVALSSSLPFVVSSGPEPQEEEPTPLLMSEDYTVILEFIKQVRQMDSVEICR